MVKKVLERLFFYNFFSSRDHAMPSSLFFRFSLYCLQNLLKLLISQIRLQNLCTHYLTIILTTIYDKLPNSFVTKIMFL